MSVLCLHHGGTKLQRSSAPFPVAATGAPGQRERFTQQFGRGRQRDLKAFGIFRRVLANFLVNHHGEIQSQLRGSVTATAVEPQQFVKTYARGTTAAGVKENRQLVTAGRNPGELQQRRRVEFPVASILVGQGLGVLRDESVTSA